MRQIKMKLVTIIDQLYYNLHFYLYGENYSAGMLKKSIRNEYKETFPSKKHLYLSL